MKSSKCNSEKKTVKPRFFLDKLFNWQTDTGNYLTKLFPSLSIVLIHPNSFRAPINQSGHWSTRILAQKFSR